MRPPGHQAGRQAGREAEGTPPLPGAGDPSSGSGETCRAREHALTRTRNSPPSLFLIAEAGLARTAPSATRGECDRPRPRKRAIIGSSCASLRNVEPSERPKCLILPWVTLNAAAFYGESLVSITAAGWGTGSRYGSVSLYYVCMRLPHSVLRQVLADDNYGARRWRGRPGAIPGPSDGASHSGHSGRSRALAGTAACTRKYGAALVVRHS